MLVGVAALAGWGFHRFQLLTAHLPTPLPFGVPAQEYRRQLADYAHALKEALLLEYREIFLITAVLCFAGVAVALLLGGRARGDSAPGARSQPDLREPPPGQREQPLGSSDGIG